MAKAAKAKVAEKAEKAAKAAAEKARERGGAKAVSNWQRLLTREEGISAKDMREEAVCSDA